MLHSHVSSAKHADTDQPGCQSIDHSTCLWAVTLSELIHFLSANHPTLVTCHKPGVVIRTLWKSDLRRKLKTSQEEDMWTQTILCRSVSCVEEILCVLSWKIYSVHSLELGGVIIRVCDWNYSQGLWQVSLFGRGTDKYLISTNMHVSGYPNSAI